MKVHGSTNAVIYNSSKLEHDNSFLGSEKKLNIKDNKVDLIKQ